MTRSHSATRRSASPGSSSPSGRQGLDPRPKACLDPDHVADSGDDTLIEKGLADERRRSCPQQPPGSLLAVESGGERIGPELGEARVVAKPRLAHESQGLAAHLRGDAPARGQHEPRLAGGEATVGSDKPAPGHPEMAVQHQSTGEVREQVLAPSLDGFERAALELRRRA